MSSHVHIRGDSRRRRSSHRQVRAGRRVGRRITGLPRDDPTDEKVPHPDVKTFQKFQENKKRCRVKMLPQEAITD